MEFNELKKEIEEKREELKKAREKIDLETELKEIKKELSLIKPKSKSAKFLDNFHQSVKSWLDRMERNRRENESY